MFVLSTKQRIRRRSNAFASVNVTVNGFLQGLANSVFQPTVFIAAVAWLFGASHYMIAGFVVANGLAWALAPFVTELGLSIFKRPYPIVVTASVVRVGSVIGMMLQSRDLNTRDQKEWIGDFLITFCVYQASTAVANSSSARTLSGAIAGPARLAIFQTRALASLLGGLLASVVVWNVIRSSDITRGFAIEILIMFASCTVIAAVWFLFAVPNTIRSGAPGQGALGTFTQFRALASQRLRRYLAFRIALGAATAADAFVIIYGIRELDLSLELVGLALIWLAVGSLGTHLFWAIFDRQSGPRLGLQWASLFHLVFILTAVAIPSFVDSTLYTDRFDSLDTARNAFVALFALLGIAISSLASSNYRYLYETNAPEHLQDSQRLTNFVSGFISFLPLVAAWIATEYSIEAALVTAGGFGFIALLLSGLLSETRVRIRSRR